jgi:ATP synthase protein I
LAENRDDEAHDAALRARLDTLSRSLDASKAPPDEKSPVEDTTLGGAMSLGFRVLTEFVAGVGVGALIGWQLDKWLHTSPVLLIVFLMLGTVAGFWNVYRLAVKPTARGRGPL